ncbi:PspA/IM30 family protein [Paenibacillus hexagrammi]|uniref:Uncharacterized protein n=1 Tax=Paenibacillus hexagrammi TaxID=2908839 RepID=A0ABY3SF45_9BACL|nr:hypothetical protein [Paenibacillus sp. YPD9-1]UJF32417.1 hypothetical protein L0M14_22390 [Paenibacillus sp. YPD9-1]
MGMKRVGQMGTGYGFSISEIEAAEQRYHEALQRAVELRLQCVDAEELAELRTEQAELAMRAGDEDLARRALQEKLRLEAAREDLRAQYRKCQDDILALAEELQRLRAAAGNMRPRGAGPHDDAGSREALRELEHAGRELGREAWHGLREAAVLSRETLKEASCNLREELRAVRGRLREEWQHSRFSGCEGRARSRK